jgi:hypothetical protein
MYGLPITLSPQQQLACNARQWMGLSQTQQMGALITIFAALANMPITCDALQAYAAQYACLPRNVQLAALIYLASQIVSAGGGTGQGEVVTFSSGGIGTPPPFTPQITATAFPGVSTGAVATDTSTGQQWVFYNGIWQ